MLIESGKRVLVLCPNAIDAILGCGGTLDWHYKNGDSIRVVIFSDGITSKASSHIGGIRTLDLELVKSQALIAFSKIGISSVTHHNFPDNRFDTVPLLDLVKKVELEKLNFEPDIIYTTAQSDLGIDHELLGRAVVTAFRPQQQGKKIRIYSFEVNSSTEWNFFDKEKIFSPDTYIDIKNNLHYKIEAYKELKLDHKETVHPRSLAALEDHARWRGSQVGLEVAEAFILIFEIIDDVDLC